MHGAATEIERIIRPSRGRRKFGPYLRGDLNPPRGRSELRMRLRGQSFVSRVLYAPGPVAQATEERELSNDLIGNSEVFPILREWDFFNHAGVAPLPRVAADALRRFATQAECTAHIGTGWYRDIETLRVASAALINAHRDEIAFIKNTSEGIATVAGGID